ncbi:MULTISPECIES: N-6 DNA methylase [Providencia]|uniref:N-6 DNA methylase n=1 Tax=Providencia TaxID=586 RepID=UPI0004F82A81|nr:MULTISPECIES: N-6 DNA methylase [Providencia]AIN62209.1 N-6 DNA Methylase family protein [Providencia stuartii]MDT7047866.1 N-6 DNA methylase [Providencia stuartii]
MSQLSFFDVDLSQYPKIEPSALTGAPSKGHLKGEKTGGKINLSTVSPKSNRDFHNEFIQLFNQTARYHSRVEVFRDFIHVAAISLENSVKQCPELEQTYFNVIARYERADLDAFAKLLALCVNALDQQATDFLGTVFMSLELGEGAWGQFFTPFHVSQLMSDLIIGDCGAIIEQNGYISVCEPTCGAGGMVIACANAVLQQGYNSQTQMIAVCTDIDEVAARMCYIQLALLGIPAIVNIGNSLTLDVRQTLYTPMLMLNSFRFKSFLTA